MKNIVYLLQCRECGALYVGETERPFEVRTTEHNMQARNKTPNTPWGQHYLIHHPHVTLQLKESAFKLAQVVARESDRARRKLREAVEIKARKPSVNIGSGWSLVAG